MKASSLGWIVVGMLAIAAVQRGDVVTAHAAVADPGDARQVVLRIPREDRITLAQLAELGRSVTARDLLARVGSLTDTVLILHAAPLLVRQTGLYGQSRFWVHGGELFGDLQYQMRSLRNFRTQCLIAHELAHAIEIASADRRQGTAGLRTFVLSRAFGDEPSTWRGAETEFPQEVALAVLKELLGKGSNQSALERLAASHGIALPMTEM